LAGRETGAQGDRAAYRPGRPPREALLSPTRTLIHLPPQAAVSGCKKLLSLITFFAAAKKVIPPPGRRLLNKKHDKKKQQELRGRPPKAPATHIRGATQKTYFESDRRFISS
jgi:hypothetical protein